MRLHTVFRVVWIGLSVGFMPQFSTAQTAVEEKPVEESKNEESVRPGINARFLDSELDVDEFVQIFEVESREVYAARQEVVELCGLQPEWRVADVGAGTGFFTQLFARRVGPQGWVYAIDISPRFLEHINKQMADLGISNVTSVLCSARSSGLPPKSVDCIFICDTYHHFEYPASTLASLHASLKDGGQMILIDFERIPGKSREWVLNHMRAGREVFRAEIEAAGFEFVEQNSLPAFKENYFLVFKKKTQNTGSG